MSLSDSLQIVKTIYQLKSIFWTNEISRDLSERWVSDRYPIFHQPAGFTQVWRSALSWQMENVYPLSMVIDI